MVERERPEGRGPRRFGGVVLAVCAVVALAGCSGRTTGATNVTATSAKLNFVASCSSGEQCSWYAQYRVVGNSSWTHVPSTPRGPVNGPVSNVALSETVSGLTAGAQYEYQVCGNSKPGNEFVCVGSDGTSSTTQKFVAAAGSTDWPQLRYGAAETGNNPLEVTINTANAYRLRKAWSASPGPSGGASVVANGVLYFATGGGTYPNFLSTLAAYPASCGIGGASCSPSWTSRATPGVSNSTPAVANGVVYSTISGTLQAFSASGCGAATCSPLWTSSVGAATTPVVANGVVYVGGGTNGLLAYPASGCGAATCGPLWSAPTAHGFTAGAAPAVANGVVYIGDAGGTLSAFSASGCGGATCSPLWTATTPQGFISAPVVANGVVYAATDLLYAFSASGCGAATCSPLWTSVGPGSCCVSGPAVANGLVYTDDIAYSASGCGAATCNPVWTGTGVAFPEAPAAAVANGVLYAVASGAALQAYPARGCGSSTCSPLVSISIGDNYNSSAPAVAGGEVYVSSGPSSPPSRTLFAYSLP